MKIFITFLLIFSIFNDFTSASFGELEVSSCESQVNCESVDFHPSDDSHNDSEGEEHHCHLGHSHTVIIGSYSSTFKPTKTKLFLTFPAYQAGNPIYYFNDIVRPPIA
jgi:hypothetical protein